MTGWSKRLDHSSRLWSCWSRGQTSYSWSRQGWGESSKTVEGIHTLKKIKISNKSTKIQFKNSKIAPPSHKKIMGMVISLQSWILDMHCKINDFFLQIRTFFYFPRNKITKLFKSTINWVIVLVFEITKWMVKIQICTDT